MNFIASLTYDYRKLLSHRKTIVRFSCNQAHGSQSGSKFVSVDVIIMLHAYGLACVCVCVCKMSFRTRNFYMQKFSTK